MLSTPTTGKATPGRKLPGHQEALARSEERYQGLYDNAPDMYFTLSEAGIVLSVNQFGADYLGYSKEELVGEPLAKVVHPEDLPALEEELAEIFRALAADPAVVIAGPK